MEWGEGDDDTQKMGNKAKVKNLKDKNSDD